MFNLQFKTMRFWVKITFSVICLLNEMYNKKAINTLDIYTVAFNFFMFCIYFFINKILEHLQFWAQGTFSLQSQKKKKCIIVTLIDYSTPTHLFLYFYI